MTSDCSQGEAPASRTAMKFTLKACFTLLICAAWAANQQVLIEAFKTSCAAHNAGQIVAHLDAAVASLERADLVFSFLKLNNFFHRKAEYEVLVSDERVLFLEGQSVEERNANLLKIYQFVDDSIIKSLTVVDLLKEGTPESYQALKKFIAENPKCLLELRVTMPNIARLALTNPNPVQNQTLKASLQNFCSLLDPMLDAPIKTVMENLMAGVTKLAPTTDELIAALIKTGSRPEMLAFLMEKAARLDRPEFIPVSVLEKPEPIAIFEPRLSSTVVRDFIVAAQADTEILAEAESDEAKDVEFKNATETADFSATNEEDVNKLSSENENPAHDTAVLDEFFAELYAERDKNDVPSKTATSEKDFDAFMAHIDIGESNDAEKLGKEDASLAITREIIAGLARNEDPCDDYEFEDKILHKGFSATIITASTRLSRERVAVKRINLKQNMDGSPRTVAQLKMIVSELEVMQSILDDQSIIMKYRDFIVYGNELFIVMELMSGDIKTIVQSYGNEQIPIPVICEIALQTLSALRSLHTKGIVHGAIKPKNILWNDKGQIKITDFGISQLVKNPDGSTKSLGVTQLKEDHIIDLATDRAVTFTDSKIDILATGIMIYDMAVGGSLCEDVQVTLEPNEDQRLIFPLKIMMLMISFEPGNYPDYTDVRLRSENLAKILELCFKPSSTVRILLKVRQVMKNARPDIGAILAAQNRKEADRRSNRLLRGNRSLEVKKPNQQKPASSGNLTSV